MKRFRYKLHRGIKPKELLDAARQRAEALLRERASGDWGEVRATDRAFVISGSIGRTGVWRVLGPLGRAMMGALSSLGGGRVEHGYAQLLMAEAAVRESREEPPPDGHMEYLSVQVYPNTLGAEVDIRGRGAQTARVARRLRRFLSDTPDLDLRLLAKQVGSPQDLT